MGRRLTKQAGIQTIKSHVVEQIRKTSNSKKQKP